MVTQNYIILYGNLTETTVEIYSPSQLGEEEGYMGIGVMKFDEDWNILPVTATVVASPKEAVYQDMGIAM